MVGTAAGVDVKRGDQISVAAVEFAEATQLSEPFDTAALTAELIGLLAGLIKSATVLGVAFVVIWFGVRPLTRMLAEQQQAADAAQVAGGALGADGAPMTAEDAANSIAAVRAGQTGGIPSAEEPNLIEDLTSEVMRVSQKRLEQMVELDEEQAANILKQWMRERAA